MLRVTWFLKIDNPCLTPDIFTPSSVSHLSVINPDFNGRGAACFSDEVFSGDINL